MSLNRKETDSSHRRSFHREDTWASRLPELVMYSVRMGLLSRQSGETTPKSGAFSEIFSPKREYRAGSVEERAHYRNEVMGD